MRVVLAGHVCAYAVLTACAGGSEGDTDGAVSAAIESAIVSGIYASPIQLDQGSYLGEPFVPGGASRQTVTLLAAPRVPADLDGDGEPEWLAVLAESSGGSGTFLYLTVLQQDRDAWRSLSTVFLGDRVQVTQIVVDGTTVLVDLLEPGSGEPAGRATIPETRRWEWIGNELRIDP